MASLEREVKRPVSLNEGPRNSSLGLDVEIKANMIFFVLSNLIVLGFSKQSNRPLPSSKKPHFQDEAKCLTFLGKMRFICMRIKNHFLSKASF